MLSEPVNLVGPILVGDACRRRRAAANLDHGSAAFVQALNRDDDHTEYRKLTIGHVRGIR
ncbi:hypothetical protein [Streptomyces sp. NPDC052610]|uniref:hypothetical protein n=1 Tax=Streptomyces sp. NPDC052610 TaxID=3154952 RepID=UPI003426D586